MTARRSVTRALVLVLLECLTYACSVDGAEDLRPTIGENLPATANAAVSAIASNSPMLAVDPTEPRFVVMANRIDADDFSCALQVSGDGGQNFVPANPVPTLPEGAEKCYGPEVAFDKDGVLYYLFVALQGIGNQPMGVFLTTSTDRSGTFSEPLQLLGPRNFGVRMAIDRAAGSGGRMHLVWLAANTDPGLNSLPTPPNPIMSAYSDDGGHTLSTPVQVSDPNRQFVVAPALTLGPDHRVHVAYYDLGRDQRDYHGLEGPTWEEPWSVVVAASADGGRTFGAGSLVDDNVMPTERVLLIFTMPPPTLAADDRGRLFVAWHDARNTDSDVFLRRSVDGGRTWAGAQRLNDDAVGNGKDQYQPRLAVAPNGRLDAIFYDRREDPGNTGYDVFYTFSTDGGRTFSANTKVTTRRSSARGPRYLQSPPGVFEYGSRMGLLATNDGAVAAWTDGRNATSATYQDVFTAVVRLAKATR